MSPPAAADAPLGVDVVCPEVTRSFAARMLRHLLFLVAGIASVWIISLFVHTSSASAETTPPTAPELSAVVTQVTTPIAPVLAQVQAELAAPASTDAATDTPAVAAMAVAAITQRAVAIVAPLPVVGDVVTTALPVADALTVPIDKVIAAAPILGTDAVGVAQPPATVATTPAPVPVPVPALAARPFMASAASIPASATIALTAPVTALTTPTAPVKPAVPAAPPSTPAPTPSASGLPAIVLPSAAVWPVALADAVYPRDLELSTSILSDPTFAPD